MKQKLLNNLRLRAVWLVAMILCAVTGAWAQAAYYTLDTSNSTTSNNAYASLGTATVGGIEWSFEGNGIMHPWRLGGKNLDGVNRIVLTQTAMDVAISSVNLTVGGANNITVNSLTLVVASDDSFNDIIDEVEVDFESNSTITFEPTSGDSWAKDSYYKFVFNVSVSGNSNKFVEFSKVEFYEATGGGSQELTNSNFALTDAPKALSFDLYNNASAQVINYTTSSTGTVTIADNDYATFSINETNKTITVTPTAVTPSEQTITVNQAADETYNAGSATFSLTITDSTPIPTHTATFSVNGVTSTQDFEEGAAIAFPANPADVNEKTFVGWVTEAINGTTNDAPDFVTSATMGQSNVTYYAVFATVVGSEAAASVSISSETSNVPSQYGSKNAFDECILEGITFQVQQMYANGTKLQWRAAGNSNGTGIIYNSDAISHIQSIVLVYDGSDSNKNFTLSVGTQANPTAGTAIMPSANGSTYTFDCSGSDYSYFVLTNGSGAGYLQSLTINYKEGSASITDYCTNVAADTRQNPELSFSFTEVNASIGVAPELPTLNKAEGFNGTVEYESSDESVAQIMDTETGDLRLVGEGTATITATFIGNEEFKPGSASYSLTVTDNRSATTTTQEAIELDLADIESLTRLAPVVKDANDEIVAYSYDEWPTEMSFEIVSDENNLIGSLDNNTGEIILNGVEGTVTLKAYYNYFNVNSSYKPSECTFTITVSDSHAPGAVNNPYSVAEAIEFIETLDGATSSKQVYVTGVISQIDSYNSTYKSIQYWISDDGTTTGQMEVYSGKGLNDTDFSAVTDLQLGDVVTVYGYVKMYKSTTPEFDKNNYIVSLVRKSEAGLAYETTEYNANLDEDFDTPELTNPNELTVAYSSSNTEVATVDENTGAVTLVAAGETTITASFAGNSSFRAGEASYTLTVIDPSEPVDICELVSITPTTLTIGDLDEFILNANFVDGVVLGTDYTISWSSSDTDILDLEGSTYEALAAGTVTVTVTVTATNTENYNSVSKPFTVTVEAPKTYYALVAEYSDGKYYAVNSDGGATWGATEVDAVNGKVISAQTDAISWEVIEYSGYNKFTNKSTKKEIGYKSSGTDLAIDPTAEYAKWYIDTENNTWTNQNGKSSGTVRTLLYNGTGFRNYASSNAGSSDGNNTYSDYTRKYTFASGYTREVTANNFGTICLPYDVEAGDFSGVKFYQIAGKRMNGDNVTSVILSDEVTSLEGGVAYIYQANEDAVKLIAAYSGDEVAEPFDAELSETGLTGTYEAAYIPQGKYVLKDNTLHYVNQANYVKSGANKAYIDLANVPVNNGANVKGIRINVSNDYLTGINGVNVDGRQNVIFNLSGQRVSNANKGVYIVNGKKISVK